MVEQCNLNSREKIKDFNFQAGMEKLSSYNSRIVEHTERQS